MEYPTHREKPAVMILPFHLEDRHRVTFDAKITSEQLAATAETQSSAFLDWIYYNYHHSDSRGLIYSDFPQFYTHIRGRGWHQRSKWVTIERMPISNPS